MPPRRRSTADIRFPELAERVEDEGTQREAAARLVAEIGERAKNRQTTSAGGRRR